MIDTPHIAECPAQAIACIRLTIPRAEIQKVMGPGIQEVMAVVAAQGIGPVGPWLTHHLRMDPAVFDFEIAVPVSRAVTPVGRVEAGELRATRVSRTVYRGGYEGLGDAWGQHMKWIAEQGLTPAADLWEVYTKGPESGSDPSAWCTELNRPLLR